MSSPIYIWQQPDWPRFRWDEAEVAYHLADVRHRQGLLIGRLSALGFELRDRAKLDAMTEDVCSSAAIEGVVLDGASVRSSVARRLGLEAEGLPASGRYVDGIVDVLMDAVAHAAQPLTSERLFAWHAALFPTGRSGMLPITVGGWRTSAQPMQVVSGAMGHERVHYQAPPALLVPDMMTALLDWVNNPVGPDYLVRAAIAHLWLVSIHPFDDGNGRMARTIADLLVSRSDGLPHRFYSLSAAILADRKGYYETLERTQHGGMNVTEWLLWFLRLTAKAIAAADTTLTRTLAKASFYETTRLDGLNGRQLKIIGRLLDGFEGKLSTSKYAKICHCSTDTALRDLHELCTRGITSSMGEGRGTYYLLTDRP